MRAAQIIFPLSLFFIAIGLDVPSYDAEFVSLHVRVMPELKASQARVLNSLAQLQSQWKQRVNSEHVPIVLIHPPNYEEILEGDYTDRGLELMINFNPQTLVLQKMPSLAHQPQHLIPLSGKRKGYSGLAGYVVNAAGANIILLGDTYLRYGRPIYDSSASVAADILRSYFEDPDTFDPALMFMENPNPQSTEVFWNDFVERFVSMAAASSEFPGDIEQQTSTVVFTHGQFTINLYKKSGFGVVSKDLSDLTFIKLHDNLEYRKYFQTQFSLKKPTLSIHFEPANDYDTYRSDTRAWMYPTVRDDMKPHWLGLWADCSSEYDLPLALVSNKDQNGAWDAPWQMNLSHTVVGFDRCDDGNVLTSVILYQDKSTGLIKHVDGACQDGSYSNNTCGGRGGLSFNQYTCPHGILGIAVLASVDVNDVGIYGMRIACSGK